MAKKTAKLAAESVGHAVADMVKMTIKEGGFEPNSEITINGSDTIIVGKEAKVSKKTGKTYMKTIKKQFIEGKKSSKPLINTMTMLRAICAVILRDGHLISKKK